MTQRQLFLGAYVLFPSGHFAGAWRHPYSAQDFLGPRLFQDIGRTLEDAKFDLAFIPETVSHRPGFATHGLSNALKHDPAQLAAQIAAVTTHLGVGITLSTSFNSPYNLARTLASLDHLVGGPGGVEHHPVERCRRTTRTSRRSTELGRTELYDRGDEFVESVVALWNSWGEGALVADQDDRPVRRHRQDHDARTTRASTSRCRDRSTCRAPRRATRCSSRPATPRAAASSGRAGAT